MIFKNPYHFFLASLLSLSAPAFADLGLLELDAEARAWSLTDENSSGDLSTTVQGSLRINGGVKIDKCLTLRGRLTTGDSYNVQIADTGLGHRDAFVDINLRHLYVDYKCVESQLRVEVGAMPTNGETRIGSLGISSNGWIDGVRLSLVGDEESIWVLTAGSVGDFNNANALTRNRSLNNISIGHERVIAQGTKLGATVSYFDDKTYTRAVLEYSLKKFADWLSVVTVEGLVRNTEYIGHHLRVGLSVAGFDMNLITTHVDTSIIDRDNYDLFIKDFYGFGRNYYYTISKDISASFSLFTRGRLGDSGPRFELGMIKKFN